MTDEELMARVVAGEMEALGGLFERYRGPLFGFLTRVLHNEAWAEDVLVDTFLRVHDRRRTYKAGAKFSTWLYTIAHHLAIDRLRRYTRCELPALHEQEDAVSETPDDACARAELAAAVRHAVGALPHDQRVVIVLREYEGFSYREIATVTGASEQAVRVRAHRARQILKVALAPYLQDDDPAVTFVGAET